MEGKRDVIYLSSNEALVKIFVLVLTIGISILASLLDYKSCYTTILVQACNCCCPHELSLTCSHESSSDCLTFCHKPLQGCRLTTGGNKDYVVMVPSISCSTTYLII